MPETKDTLSLVERLRSSDPPASATTLMLQAADEIERLRADLASATKGVNEREQAIIKQHTEIERLSSELERVHKYAEERRAEYCAARDSLFQFNYPPDAGVLREIADEIDCGPSCEHGYTEWDTGSFTCPCENKDGCAALKAWGLRQFADALTYRAMLSAAPSPPVQGEMVQATVGEGAGVGAVTDRLERRPAYFTHDDGPGGHLYYFGPAERWMPPYTEQRRVEAIVDVASDGTLAGVELIYDMPPPPRPGDRTDERSECDGSLNQASINAAPKPEGE